VLPEELLDAIGAPVDSTEQNETYSARFGDAHLCLRRDCHGVLRRVDLSFHAAQREFVRNTVSPAGTWQTVVVGSLDIVDLPQLGKVYLLVNRLTITVRLDPDVERMRKLLVELADASR